MGEMLDYIKREPELRERFVRKAFEQRRITDFGEFQQALLEAFDTDNGKKAQKFFAEEEVMALFESEEAKTHLRQNITEEEFNQIYGDVEKGTYSVIRKEPKGKELKKPEDAFVISVPKKIEIKEDYTRKIRGKEVNVSAYNRSFSKWSASQIRFVRVRRQTGVLSIKDVIYQYNAHFMTEPRTASSIETRFYRFKNETNTRTRSSSKGKRMDKMQMRKALLDKQEGK